MYAMPAKAGGVTDPPFATLKIHAVEMRVVRQWRRGV